MKLRLSSYISRLLSSIYDIYAKSNSTLFDTYATEKRLLQSYA